MEKSGKIVLGLAAAFAVGALAGVLFAPAEGKRTRERISRKGKHLINSMDDLLQEGKNSFADIRDSIKDKFEILKEEAEQFSKS
ncbi:MAG TPA: YtxH domain-containing protein [Daejeonella sp.]|uniref:YtxH domain-containing protein n=1 Tax=Daejeonella sp. TaxID=2805397 RepID=UPI002EDBB760